MLTCVPLFVLKAAFQGVAGCLVNVVSNLNADCSRHQFTIFKYVFFPPLVAAVC